MCPEVRSKYWLGESSLVSQMDVRITGRYSDLQVSLTTTALSATTPIYIQECHVLGDTRTIDTMIMVFWGIGGISAATWFDYAMLKAPAHGAWRVSLAMQALFLVVSLILVYGCPDSSRYASSCTLVPFNNVLVR
jgi:hypothetical protein